MPKALEKAQRKTSRANVPTVSDEQLDQSVIRARQPKSLVEFFRQSPLVGLELDLERDKDTGRDIEL